MITIKRNTGLIGSMIAMTIKVNGVKTRKISNEEIMDVEIPNDKATIKVSQLGIKSNDVKVEDGDELEITLRK